MRISNATRSFHFLILFTDMDRALLKRAFERFRPRMGGVIAADEDTLSDFTLEISLYLYVKEFSISFVFCVDKFK